MDAPVREDPPSTGGSKGSWVERLLPLMDEPGVWFRVAESDLKKGGESTAYALRSGRLRTPPGQWEFTSAWMKEEGVSRTYARYLGDPSDPAPREVEVTPVIHDTPGETAVVPEHVGRIEGEPVYPAAPAATAFQTETGTVPAATPNEAPSVGLAANPPVFAFGATHQAAVAVQPTETEVVADSAAQAEVISDTGA